MSEFYVYDGADRIGILEHWSSVQWLEQYASGGEAKIVAMATPQNVALLAVGRALYNPETGTAAHILSQQIDDKGASPTITLRGAVGAARLAQRVVMGTVAVKDAETGMRAMVSQNLRGLPISLGPSAGTNILLDTQVTWGSVLEGLETLASASGLGFGCTFDPAAGTEAFAVYAGQDRTQGEGYNGYLGDDISNITDLKLVRGVNDHYNVAVVCGQGEGAARAVVLVGSGEGTARRELYVDAKDIAAEYQTATDTGRKDEAGNPIYEYATYSNFTTPPQLRVRVSEDLFEKKIDGILQYKSQKQIDLTIKIQRENGTEEFIRECEFDIFVPARCKELFAKAAQGLA